MISVVSVWMICNPFYILFRMLLFILACVGLLFVLLWLAQKRVETFADLPLMPSLPSLPSSSTSPLLPEGMPEPAVLIKKVRAMLDSIDKPDLWNHAVQVADKDPGQLARMYAEEQKSKQVA